MNKGPLAEAIKRDFGSHQNLVQLLTNACVGELVLLFCQTIKYTIYKLNRCRYKVQVGAG